MKVHREYQIGDVIPAEPQRGVLGADMDEAWFAFQTPPLKETAAIAWLAKRGVDAWRPTETRWRFQPRAKVKRVKFVAGIVPRYVFARFDQQPLWHRLRQCQYLSGVVGMDGTPILITPEVMADMADVPQRLAKLRADREIARAVLPGCHAKVLDGAMAGWVVEVTALNNGIASFVVPLLGDRMTHVEVSRLRKVEAA